MKLEIPEVVFTAIKQIKEEVNLYTESHETSELLIFAILQTDFLLLYFYWVHFNSISVIQGQPFILTIFLNVITSSKPIFCKYLATPLPETKVESILLLQCTNARA